MWPSVIVVWPLLFGIGLLAMGNGLQGTLLGVRATIESFSTVATGAMMACYFVGMLLGSLATPYLLKRVGHVRVFAALASLISIAILVHSVWINFFVWSLMRIATGFSYAGLYIVAEGWLNDRSSNANRGKMLALYMLIITLNTGLGQLLLKAADPAGDNLFMLVSVLVSFALIPILLAARSAPLYEATQSMPVRVLYQKSPLAVSLSIFTGAGHGTLFGLGALYAINSGLSTDGVAVFMFAMLMGGLVAQWPSGWISDIVGRREVILPLSFTAVLACCAALVVPNDQPLYIPIIALIGFSCVPIYSLAIAYANDRLEHDEIVPASGCLVFVSCIGLSFGTVAVSFLMGFFGNAFFLISLACIFAIISLLTMDSLFRRKVSVITGEKLIAGPIGSPVASFVAPDASDYAQEISEESVESADESVEDAKAS